MDDGNAQPPRFWAKVNKAGPAPEHRPDLGPCWLWMNTTTLRGYGTFKVQGKNQLAHRLAYTALVGPIPDGLELDHLCRVHACVRPTHLEAVTHLENVRRGENATKTHCAHGHAFTPENTGIKPGNGQRYCLTCAKAQQREYFPIWYAQNRERLSRERRLARQRKKEKA